jgi:hypothetical protein
MDWHKKCGEVAKNHLEVGAIRKAYKTSPGK